MAHKGRPGVRPRWDNSLQRTSGSLMSLALVEVACREATSRSSTVRPHEARAARRGEHEFDGAEGTAGPERTLFTLGPSVPASVGVAATMTPDSVELREETGESPLFCSDICSSACVASFVSRAKDKIPSPGAGTDRPILSAAMLVPAIIP